jgi:hypothetical protein
MERDESNPCLEIYDTAKKGNIRITGVSGLYDIAFDRDFFITETIENNIDYLVKVSYDGKSIDKLTQLENGDFFVIGDFIYFYQMDENNKKSIYRMQKDGKGLMKITD